MRHAYAFLCFALFLPGATWSATQGEESVFLGSGDVLMVQGAPGVIHFESSPDHVKYSWLVGVEWQRPSNWLAGYAYFNNSFGQKSHYLYVGKSWQLGERDSSWYFKLTGGLIEGYREPHEDKLPINHNGIGPAIIPGLGYRHDRFNVQTNLLGIRAVMITVGYDIYRR
jgi:hypothetical protein